MSRTNESTLDDPKRREYATYLKGWLDAFREGERRELPYTWDEWLRSQEKAEKVGNLERLPEPGEA